MKLLNISGEPREYNEKGFIYEFPFPSSEPTEVPNEVAKKLLKTGQYKEVSLDRSKIKVESEVLIKEEEENAI